MEFRESIINDYRQNVKIANDLKIQRRRIKKKQNKNKQFIFTIINISQCFLILGGFGWGIVSFFELYNQKNNGFDNIISLIMGIIGISSLIMITTNGIKPSFIGDYILPPTAIFESYPVNYDIVYNLETIPNSYIIYWAAKKTNNTSIKIKEKSVGNFENSGVVKSDKYGHAKIYLQYPSNILTNDIVPRILNKHFSYRILNKKTGILSDIIIQDISDVYTDNTIQPEKPIPLRNNNSSHHEVEKMIINNSEDDY